MSQNTNVFMLLTFLPAHNTDSSFKQGQIRFDCLVTKKGKLTLQYSIPTLILVKSVSCEYSNHMEVQS